MVATGTNPRVSVLIDTFNHERYIEQAIESVLGQTLPRDHMEIIVVDDGSTDRTAEIVRGFEPRLRLIQKKNGGQASAFNILISQARSDIVAFLDGDDWWASGKLSAVLDAFKKNPTIAAVGHGFFEADESSSIAEVFTPQENCFLDLSSVQSAHLADLGRTLLGTSRLAVRRRVLDKIGPLPENLVFCADTPILTLALALGGAIILREPLCYYRIHSQNLFGGNLASERKVRAKAEILGFQLESFPARLRHLGVSDEVIASLFESDRIELERIKIQLGERGRWETFQTELRDFRSSYKNPSLGYRTFRYAVGALTLLLPPRRFYDLRAWYSRHNVRRFRSRFASAEPTVPDNVFVRRPVPKARP